MEQTQYKRLGRIFLLATVFLFTLTFISAGVCNDGIDNDGDGGIDAFMEEYSNSQNGQWVQTWATSCTTACGSQGMIPGVNQNGDACTSGETVVKHATDALGLKIYKAGCWPWGCATMANIAIHDGSKSFSRSSFCYKPGQKRDNDATDVTAACYCVNDKPTCSDGIDNDNDGLIDMNDPGCETPNDIDERPHDEQCTNPTDNSEAAECDDNLDNDNDGYIDQYDSGCWDDTSDPTTYNPNRDDESGSGGYQCFDGIDNDNDGTIDALVEDGDGTTSLHFVFNGSWDFRAYINPLPYNNIPNSGSARWDHTTRSKICELMGFSDYTSNLGDSSPYSSCGDNTVTYWDESIQNFKTIPACQDNRPLGYLKCINPINNPECADGIDNDGDGNIDLNDDGCYSAYDVSEEQHDLECTDPTDDTEAPELTECEDNIDNDNDGLTDEEDPGCWDDTTDHTTYNPNLDDESRADGQCVEDTDCGTNYYSGPYCGNDGDVYKDYHAFSCTLDATCNEDIFPTKIQNCDEGCTSGVCNEDIITQCEDDIDNDGDNLIDENDPGCWDDPADSDTYNPNLDNEEKYTVTCNIDSDCGNDIPFGGICQEGDAYNIILHPTCNYGGTGVSFCSTTTQLELEETCSFGCSEGICQDAECTQDSDCGSDFYSDAFCGQDNNVYKIFYDVSCGIANMCGEDTSEVLVEECDYTCSDGSCGGQCLVPEDCGDDYYGEEYCGIDGNVYKDYYQYNCASNECSVTKTNESLVETCENGCNSGTCNEFSDQNGPQVELINPEDGDTVSGDVTFDYTATDNESSIENCSLIIDGVIIATDTSVENGVNTFIESFDDTNTTYDAKVGCYDENDNYAESEEISFFYEELVCEEDNDCGSYNENYFCEGDDLLKTVQSPICTDNVCDTETSEIFVRTCSDSCSNGICVSDDDDDKRYDDDTNNIPIYVSNQIRQTPNATGAGEILFVETAQIPILGAEDTQSINWWVVVMFLLILGIILLLILIILSTARD